MGERSKKLTWGDSCLDASGMRLRGPRSIWGMLG